MKRLNNWYPYEKNLKNRSGKHKNLIIGRKSILRCVSMEQLKDWAEKEVPNALKEYNRRKDKIERRYGSKIDIHSI